MIYLYRNRDCAATPWAISTVKLTEDSGTRALFPASEWHRIPAAFEGGLVVKKDFAPADVSVLNNTITETAHGWENGQAGYFRSTGVLPPPLVKNTTYYIVEKTADTYKVSTAPGGAAVDLTGQGTGTHSFYAYQHFGQPMPGFDANPANPTVYVDGAFGLLAEAMISDLQTPAWDITAELLSSNGFLAYNRPNRRVFDDFRVLTPSANIWTYRRRHGQGRWVISRLSLTTDPRTRGVFTTDLWERITVSLTDGTSDVSPMVQFDWQFYYLADQYLQNRPRAWLSFPPQFLLPNGIAATIPDPAITPLPAEGVAETWPTRVVPTAAEGLGEALGPSAITPAAAEGKASTYKPDW